MKNLIFITVLSLILLLFGTASAEIDFTFSANNLDLNHDHAYYWGINVSDVKANIDSGYSIVSASLNIKNIDNWYEPEWDALYLKLMDNWSDSAGWTGVYPFSDDSSTNSDYFASWNGLSLTPYSDDNGTGYYDNYQYVFSSSLALSTLTNYIANNGYIGYGIDPDCHYNHDGLYFEVTLDRPGAPVPEPATMILFGTGLVALGGMTRKRLKNR